jgi:hypothetical protein
MERKARRLTLKKRDRFVSFFVLMESVIFTALYDIIGRKVLYSLLDRLLVREISEWRWGYPIYLTTTLLRRQCIVSPILYMPPKGRHFISLLQNRSPVDSESLTAIAPLTHPGPCSSIPDTPIAMFPSVRMPDQACHSRRPKAPPFYQTYLVPPL